MIETVTMKKFTVLYDVEKNIKVVLSKWIAEDGETYKYPIGNTQKSILEERDPDTDWEETEIEKICKHEDDYVKAVQFSKLPLIQLLSDASDDDKLKNSRSSRHKKNINSPETNINKNRNNKRRISSSDDGETDDSDGAEASKKNKQKKTNLSSDRATEKNESTLPKSSVPSNLHIIPASLSIRPSSSQSNFEEFESENQDEDPLAQDNEVDLEDIIPNTLDNENINKIMIANFAINKQILKKQNSLMLRMDKIEKKIDRQKSSYIASATLVTNTDVENRMKKYFPINTNPDEPDHKIEIIESKLENDGQFVKDVVNFLKSKGGNNQHDMIQTLMSCLMTNEVMTGYSYHGQSRGTKKNQSFKNLRLKSAIEHAVKKKFANFDETEAKDSMKTWLDSAGTRLKRAVLGLTKRSRASDVSIPLAAFEDDD